MCDKSYIESLFKKDPYNRELSWHFCREAFLNARNKKEKSSLSEEEYDNLAKDLAVYLSSWGMYRGSTFLFHKNYKVHTEVVELLLCDEYNDLWDIQCDINNDKQVEKYYNLLFEKDKGLCFKIFKLYNEKRKEDEHNITETLITKIILGTFACLPAYDTNLKTSIIKENNGKTESEQLPHTLIYVKSDKNNKVWVEVIDLNEFKKLLKRAERFMEFEVNKVKYTKMKCLDMEFWKKGLVEKIKSGEKEDVSEMSTYNPNEEW